MVIAVRTEQHGDDLVVVKQARTDGDVARLSAEAEMLTRARHPGVVELLAVEERSLRLAHGGTALARLGPFPLDVTAGIVSAVADVVDAIHRLGVAHGDLDADHVLLDRRGRPRLCGFGHATSAGEATTADDVAALGLLLRRLLAAGERLAWHQAPAGLRRRATARRIRKELDALATRATHPERALRPTARQFAKSIHAAVAHPVLPDEASLAREAPSFATLPADLDPTADLGWTDADLSFLTSSEADPTDDAFTEAEESDDQWRERNPDLERARIDPAALAGVAAVPARAPTPPPVVLPDTPSGRHSPPAKQSRRATVLAAFAAVAVTGIVGGAVAAQILDPFGGGADTPATTAATIEPTTTTLGARTPPPYPSGCTRVPDPGPDSDGDGCPDLVELDGREARIGTVTITLGADGDEILLGDWNCDGTTTPAVFRPSTGEVFVFPRWSLDEPIEVEAVERDPDATGIRAGSDPCPPLLVDTPDGTRTIEIAP